MVRHAILRSEINKRRRAVLMALYRDNCLNSWSMALVSYSWSRDILRSRVRVVSHVSFSRILINRYGIPCSLLRINSLLYRGVNAIAIITSHLSIGVLGSFEWIAGYAPN